MKQLDVLIVGAGISGIGSACHLLSKCPGKSFAIIEARDEYGGTWDLFRYPGIRSDSDMHTLGFNFKPWVAEKSIADGPSIKKYLKETIDENNLAEHIQYKTKMMSANWSSEDRIWSVDIVQNGQTSSLSCKFLMMCSGYYNYEKPFRPDFQNEEVFTGQTIHPQLWPKDLDYKDKKIVVIGSGATAMTLVPALADKAEIVTMVQRSPTYVVSMPDEDRVANLLRKLLPSSWAYAITRFKNTKLQQIMYKRMRTHPQKMKRYLVGLVKKALGPEYDVDTHFTPSYNPWDQRMCLIPNGDLFRSLRSGKTQVVTEHIECFTPNGLRLKSGQELEADIIVTATGLNMQLMGGAEFYIDDRPIDFAEKFSYKGMMYAGIPNLIQTFGYINASWTLRADLTAEYACRLINRIDELGADYCVARLAEEDSNMMAKPWIENFSAGYIQRSLDLMPKQGEEDPWRNTQNYALDKKIIRDAPLEDGVMTFVDVALTQDAPDTGVGRDNKFAA